MPIKLPPATPGISMHKKQPFHLRRPHGRLLTAFLFIGVLAAGFYLRIDNLAVWKANPDQFFFNDTPILLNVDGYYYLDLARDLLESSYERLDPNRAVPAGAENPWPPPLLSVLTAAVAKISGWQLEWIAIITPTLLGLLLAFPVFALGRCLGGTAMGLAAAFIVLTFRYYLARSSLGWFDTDMLNGFFIITPAYLFLKFGTEVAVRRYYYLLAGLLTYLVALWWWNFAPQVVSLASLVPFAIALLFYYRPPRRQAFILLGLTFGGLLLFLLLTDMNLLGAITSTWGYIQKKTSVFPTMGLDVAEQERPSLAMLVQYSLGNTPSMLLAGLGLAGLVWRKRKACLFLLFPFGLAVMALFAKRFIIFMAPMAAFGIGFVIQELWDRRHHHFLYGLAAPLVLAAVFWPTLHTLRQDNSFIPMRKPYHLVAMSALGASTPPESVIWTDWGHGYPLNFYSRRGTLADGSIHSGRHLFVMGTPLAVDNFRLAANWMQFYAKHGMAGLDRVYENFGRDWDQITTLLKEVFAGGPDGARDILAAATGIDPAATEQWLEFFFPEPERPVYLFLDLDKINTAWFYYGTWSFAQKKGRTGFFRPVQGLKEAGNHIGNDFIDVDIEQGRVRLGSRQLPLKELTVTRFVNNRREPQRTDYGRQAPYRFEYIPQAAFGVLMDDAIADSVAAKLFARVEGDNRYFLPQTLMLPLYQVWKVSGDTYSRTAPQ